MWASRGTRAPPSVAVSAAPPTLSAPLEDERPTAGLREVRGRDQGVVAAADDDDVELVRHRSGGLSAAGPEDLHRGDPAVRAHDPAAGMGRGAAQPEVADRRPEARVAGHRSVEEELLE